MQTALEAIRAHGFDVRDLKDNGRFNRFDIGKKRGAGFYKVLSNGAVTYGNWATSEKYLWHDNASRQLTQAEANELKARAAEARRKEAQTREQTEAAAAAEAERIWNTSPPASPTHPYLVKKGVKPHDLRQHGDALLVPMYDGQRLVNLQRIYPDSKKLFLRGGRKKGCYSTIEGRTEAICLAEGWATAATINEATGQRCIVAMDCGNLLPVARTIKPAVICGDNDSSKEENMGAKKAHEAAEEMFCAVALPPDFEGSDWNDYAALHGLEAVAKLIAPKPKTLPPAVSETLAALNAPTNARQTSIVYDVDENGRPKATIENVQRLCEAKGITLRYNVITKQSEVLIPNESYQIDNAANSAMARIVSMCRSEDIGVANIAEYLDYLCDAQPFNPAATWIMSKPWDGVSRLGEFFSTIRSPNPALRDTLIFRWMLSAVAALFNPAGVSAHGVLVLCGAQNVGKTSWFKRLVPQEMGLTADGFILRCDDRDSQFQCLTNWLVELGELDATFKKSEIAQLKAFITKDKDTLRKPYARRESTFARRTVFFASVNETDFLVDTTGNRRFWTIDVISIDYNHNIDMQQVWAEIWENYKQGEKWVLDRTELDMLNESNTDHTGGDYHLELLMKYYKWDEVQWGDWKTATEIARFVGINNPNQNDLNKLARAARKLNGDKKRKHGGVRQVWVPEGR